MTSRITYPGAGTLYAIPFPYLDPTHVKVKVDNVELATDAYSFPTSGMVQLAVDPGAADVTVYRQTPEEPLTVYQSGSVLSRGDLETDSLQALYRIEEVADTVPDFPDVLIPGSVPMVNETGTGYEWALGGTNPEALASLALGTGAALVGFKQSGTGAVTRTVQDKLRDHVSVLDFIPVAEHAAIKDGTSTYDCASDIQAAIDYAVYTSKQRVYAPAGRYLIGKTLHLGYGTSSTSAYFYGDGKRYRGDVGFVGTLFVATFSDAPVIAVQGGRGTIIKGIALRGLNYDHILDNGLGGSAPLLDDLDVANWVDPTLHANAASRYAPYCGVAIDPYSGAAPTPAYPAVDYPAFLGAINQYGKAVTSEVLLDDVAITGFVVAVAIKPSNSDGNADYTRLRDCFISECVYGVSVGHTQSRLVDITNTNAITFHTFLTTKVHGMRAGRGAFRLSNCEPGSGIQIIDASSALGGPCIFEYVYAEAIYKIGSYASGGASSEPMEIIGSTFSFTGQQTRGVPVFVLDVTSTQLAMRGVSLAGGMGTHHIKGGNTAVLDNVSIQPDASSPNSGTVDLYRASALGATLGITFSTSTGRTFAARGTGIRVNGLWKNLDTGAEAGAATFGDIVTCARSRVIPFHSRQVTPASAPGSLIAAPIGTHSTVIGSGDTSLSQSGGEVVLTLNSPYANDLTYNWQGMNPGDLCIHDTSNTVFYIRARTAGAITLVAQNNIDGAGDLLETISGGNFYFYNCRMFSPSYPTLATFATGSPTLTDVGRDDDYAGYLAGQVMADDAFYVNPYEDAFIAAENKVTAVDGTARTITLNGNPLKAGERRIQLMIRKAPPNV